MGGFGEIRGTFGRYGEPAEQAVEAVEAAKDPKELPMGRCGEIWGDMGRYAKGPKELPRGWARVEAQPVGLR